MSGIPREAWEPNSKEDEKLVESQGRLRIQTQKKKRNEWNPKGGLGSKLKRRRETSGIPREAWNQNSKEDKGTSRGGSSILHPIFVAVPTEIVIRVR
jgi:hypothetical protein